MKRGTSTRTSSMSSASFFRIKNSYRKSGRTTSTGSSSGASSNSSNSSGSELDFDVEEGDEEEHELEDEEEEDDVIGDMYINEQEQDDLFDGAILKQIQGKREPVRLTLKLQVTETTFSVWETVLHNNTLYVELPRVLLPEASKHSFMSVLEFAEERLECAQLVLYMRKAREDRQNLIRTFLFLGFQPLSPKSPFVREAVPEVIPGEAGDNLYLMYTIVDDDDDEESSSSDEGLSEDE